MVERRGAVTFKGNPMTLVGDEVQEGKKAPDFTLVGNDLSETKLSDLAGKTVVLLTVPSLDTGVCDKETRTFNQRSGSLGDNVAVVCVSRDLPFAQKRWCGAAGVENVQTLSDYKEHAFGKDYGLEIKELGLLARAVLVLDGEGTVRYKQLVPEVAEEPDYDAAAEAVKSVG